MKPRGPKPVTIFDKREKPLTREERARIPDENLTRLLKRLSPERRALARKLLLKKLEPKKTRGRPSVTLALYADLVRVGYSHKNAVKVASRRARRSEQYVERLLRKNR